MPTVVDLFSGCGGFSLGAHKAGFSTALAIDVDQTLTSSYATNFPNSRVVNRDIRSIDRGAIKSLLPKGADGVIGGPPCQAFSSIGKRDTRDPRRLLVKEFFRVVELIRPKFFVFENVKGLGFRENIHILERGLEELSADWRIIGPVALNAKDFGAPTSRMRLFVFGFRKSEMRPPDAEALTRPTLVKTCVKDAIADLADARHQGANVAGFDYWKYDGRRRASDYAKLLRARSGQFTGHNQTVHSPETARRFAKLKPGMRDEVGRYPRLSWDGTCPTLRAGTGSDRGSYQAVRPVHPSEHRVITPREAARLQGFPDEFIFHPTVWHSCRMIGNSVSPIIAHVLLKRVRERLASG